MKSISCGFILIMTYGLYTTVYHHVKATLATGPVDSNCLPKSNSGIRYDQFILYRKRWIKTKEQNKNCVSWTHQYYIFVLTRHRAGGKHVVCSFLMLCYIFKFVKWLPLAATWNHHSANLPNATLEVFFLTSTESDLICFVTWSDFFPGKKKHLSIKAAAKLISKCWQHRHHTNNNPCVSLHYPLILTCFLYAITRTWLRCKACITDQRWYTDLTAVGNKWRP